MAIPNRHLVLVILLALTLAGISIGVRAVDPRANAANATDAAPVPAPLADPPAIAPPVPPQPKYEPVRTPVLPGDTLSTIFKRHGLADRDLQLVLSSGPLGKRLATIHPGHEFEFEHDEHGNLLHMKYRLGRLDTVEFERVGDAFQGAEVVREPDRLSKYTHGVIEQSLFQACQRIGLGDGFAQRLARIFQWDVDFILDIRAGDEFHVLYQELYLDDERIGVGDILVAQVVNQGEVYTAARYENDAGVAEYYTPEGANMHKTFLRAPVDYTRISSNFNLRRKHPLWKSTMPHRGIDYAAPTGTPVRAAGAGKVITRSRTPANGRYIVIQHGQRYQTKYLHLSRFARDLRVGQAVRQGQTIGYVGATGWATGAHLHYEFLVDGVHRNPRTVDLPPAQHIAKADRRNFELQTSLLLAELDRSKAAPSVALETAR